MKRSTKREIDDLGRITVPANFREELGIETGEKVEIYMDGGRVILKRAVKTDPLSEISSLKERINKAYEIAWENDIPSPTYPEYKEMHNALKAIMDVLKGGISMREILFKAKRIDNGEWVEGYYVHANKTLCKNDVHVIFNGCDLSIAAEQEVDPETVCQYTGLTDRNGVKIFEGDIISYNGSHKTVVYDTSLRIPCFTTGIGSGSSTPMHPYKLGKRCVVIGNIHDKEE